MSKLGWIAIIFSAFLYGIPFIYNTIVWWLIFMFPIPLLYIARIQNLSFFHGYIWGFIVFFLHLHEGIFIVTHLAGDYWGIGFLMSTCMVIYQALWPGLLFYGVTHIIIFFSIKSSI